MFSEEDSAKRRSTEGPGGIRLLQNDSSRGGGSESEDISSLSQSLGWGPNRNEFYFIMTTRQ